MLGFDATGRLALGQVRSSITTILVANAASFTYTGNAATFKISMPPAVASFALTGNAASFTVTMPSSVASFIVNGNPAWFVTSQRKPLYISGSGYWRGHL